jgi:pimeloyl-ACP methyl ester carboxylesterase
MNRKKTFLRISIVVLIVLAAVGSVFYTRPTWVFSKVQELRLRLAGVQSCQVVIGGHRIHYYVRGPVDGTPVVLIHGLGGRSEDWTNLAPYLERAGYRVYTPDLLGFGQSEEPTNATYSIADQARLIVHFLDRMGLQQADLAGWSMGGWIAQKVAVDHPSRVRRLVLMDSAGLMMRPDWDTRLFTPTTPEELDKLDALLMPHPPTVPGFVAQDILRLSASYAWVVKRALASMMTAQDVTDADLPKLRMPVLILWGAEDRITPLSEGQAMHALMPQSRLAVAPGCGHLAPQSCSKQFGPEMVKFLQSDDPMSAGDRLMAGRRSTTDQFGF